MSSFTKQNLRDLTPRSLYCGVGACPAVFQTPEGDYLLVGSLVSSEAVPSGRVGPGEVVVRVPRALLQDIGDDPARE